MLDWIAIHRKKLVLAAALVLLSAWGAPRLSSDWQLHRRQRDFFEAVEDRNLRRLEQLISADYSDDWQLNAADLLDGLSDARGQFLTLSIAPEAEVWGKNGNSALYEAKLALAGKPIGPGGGEILTRTARFRKPFRFSWEKENAWPWGWKLRRIVQEELRVPEGW
jgi:hypothetical protein